MPRFRPRLNLASAALLMLAASACASWQPSAPARLQSQAALPGLKRFLSGSAADARIQAHGPALLLAGGGEDQVSAMQWQIDAVRGCSDCETRLDLVILRASGADGYHELYGALKGLDSMETFVLTTREAAENPEVLKAVAAAEVVFFAGGDQCDYVRLFKNGPIAGRIQALVAQGGGVGGTSAGLAIQGSLIYDACSGSVTSAEALADPYHAAISFSSGLFAWPPLAGVITDTHFAQRDRMGRLLAFLARGLRETGAPRLRGLAVDEASTLGVDARGLARLFGKHQAYLVEASSDPAAVVAKGQPLSQAGYRIQRLKPGQSIDLSAPLARDAYRIDVLKGKLSGNPY